MTDIYDIYLEVNSRVNKEENGYLPADLFNTYCRAADRFVFNDYITQLQNMQTASIAKLMLEDRLAPFEMSAAQPATGGIFTTPADCAYFRSAKIKSDGGAAAAEIFALNAQLCEAEEDPTINVADIKRKLEELTAAGNWVSVDLRDHDQISKRLNSYVPGKKPSLKKPVMERVTVNGVRGFQVYPPESLSVTLSYYRRPVSPLLVMKVNTTTLALEYDLANSKQFEWEGEAMGDVISKIVTDFAIYIREGGLFQMSMAEQQKT